MPKQILLIQIIIIIVIRL